MSIVEEFFDFFNDLIAGKNIDSDVSDQVLNTIKSESTMEAVSLKLNTTFKKFTQTTEQNLYANKKITYRFTERVTKKLSINRFMDYEIPDFIIK